MKILAIDFGIRNIGLAISEGELAEPFRELKVKSTLEAFNQLKKICLENKIELLVLGLPQGKLVTKIKKFAKELRKQLNLPVVLQDETLTSKEAVKKMIEAGKPLKKRRKEKHIIAACLILQSYLDQGKQKMIG